MRTISRLHLAVCGAALALFAVEPSATLFENDQVKVARALEKAHVKGGFHEHKPNRVMVYLQAGKQRFEYQDGRQPKVFDWKPGQVVWSRAEGMHSPEVVGDDPFNIIEVELKNPGSKTPSSSQNPATIDAKHFTSEIENDQVRVVRLKLGPHESTPMFTNDFPQVVVFLTDRGTHKAGEAIWAKAGSRKEENQSDKPVELVIVEVKN